MPCTREKVELSAALLSMEVPVSLKMSSKVEQVYFNSEHKELKCIQVETFTDANPELFKPLLSSNPLSNMDQLLGYSLRSLANGQVVVSFLYIITFHRLRFAFAIRNAINLPM